jgi:Flp pilus assembly protein TadD
VIELRAQWESGYIGVARVYSAQRNYVEGEQILRQGIPRVKEPKYINFWLGVMLYRQGRYTDAEPEFEKAAQLVPDDPGVQSWLGSNLEKLQRFPEARAAYERALAIDPNYQDAKDGLARLTSQGH